MHKDHLFIIHAEPSNNKLYLNTLSVIKPFENVYLLSTSTHVVWSGNLFFFS